jgi:hypothetical protein
MGIIERLLGGGDYKVKNAHEIWDIVHVSTLTLASSSLSYISNCQVQVSLFPWYSATVPLHSYCPGYISHVLIPGSLS